MGLREFKYEPSAGVLDDTYQRLLNLRTILRRQLSNAINTTERGERWHVEIASLYDQVDLIESLLQPFRDEEEYWRERWEERRCAAIMRL